MEFRKKPVVVEAIQYVDEASGERIISWTSGTPTPAFWADPGGLHDELPVILRVKTLESGGGSHVVDVGDWVICGVSGKHYPCKPDIFEKTYDVADELASMSPSEAVYGFASWLTTRGRRTVMSSSDDASPVANLVDAFCRENGLEKPRDEWTSKLKHPT
jgi:hypothetical protein